MASSININNKASFNTVTLELANAENNALNLLLELALSTNSLNDYLDKSVKTLIDSVPWLNLLPKGGVLLTDLDSDDKQLKLVSEFGLSPELLTLCKTVDFGYCLCGRAAKEKIVQFASCVDDRHDIRFEGMAPHGHYNIPLIKQKEVLGVLVLYLPHGHEKNDKEVQFLERVAHVLSMGVSQRYIINNLDQSLKNEELANKAKTKFMSIISHELKTPLNSIVGFSDLLTLEKNLSTEGHDYVTEIKSSSDQLNAMINGIIEHVSLDSAKEMHLEHINLKDVIEVCCDPLKPKIKKKNITLELDIDSNISLLANRDYLQRVLKQLITNAVTFNKTRGKVLITTMTTNSYVKTSIVDSGIGIKPENMEQLFTPFNRLGAENSANRGIGLGLVSAKRLVESMNGKVGATSVYGKGSTFWFEIKVPAKQPQIIL